LRIGFSFCTPEALMRQLKVQGSNTIETWLMRQEVWQKDA